MNNIRNEYVINKKSAYMKLKNKKEEIYKVFIDHEDIEKIKHYRWHLEYYKTAKCYYVRTTIHLGMIDGKNKSKCILLHSMIMGVEKNTIIDHKNHNPLDNRKKNLRIVEASNNSANRKGANSNNKTGVRNVHLINRYGGKQIYMVQIMRKGERFSWEFELNQFDEACIFAEEKRKELFGKYAGNG